MCVIVGGGKGGLTMAEDEECVRIGTVLGERSTNRHGRKQDEGEWRENKGLLPSTEEAVEAHRTLTQSRLRADTITHECTH